MLRVERLRRTCSAMPAQWEGLTENGRSIYVRYRHSVLRIGVGNDLGRAIDNAFSDDAVFILRLGPHVSSGMMSFGELKRLTEGRIEWPSEETDAAH